jgi:hypothetical protein
VCLRTVLDNLKKKIIYICALGNYYRVLYQFIVVYVVCLNLKIKIYRLIILPVVLYGRETWSLTLREERRLRVFENRVLGKVFGPKRDEVTGNGESCITRR